MSRLVRLYPAAWRARYESECQALLADRPPGLGDVVDTIRGAVDAHLHPHLVDDRDRFRQPWTHRLPGLIALSAGLLWTANLALVAVEGPTGSGNLSLLGTALLVMAVSLPGDYLAVHGRRIATALGLVGACLVSANLLPWALAQVPYLTGWAVVLAGMLALAAARAGVGAAGRWIFVAASVVIPAMIGLPALLGLLDNGEPLLLTALLPYGLAWMSLGARLTIRGAATIEDLPFQPSPPEDHAHHPTQSEVQPA